MLLTDVNDQIPYFVGVDSSGKYPAAVTPNTKAGEDVVTVTAIDRDGTSPNNLVSLHTANTQDIDISCHMQYWMDLIGA